MLYCHTQRSTASESFFLKAEKASKLSARAARTRMIQSRRKNEQTAKERTEIFHFFALSRALGWKCRKKLANCDLMPIYLDTTYGLPCSTAVFLCFLVNWFRAVPRFLRNNYANVSLFPSRLTEAEEVERYRGLFHFFTCSSIRFTFGWLKVSRCFLRKNFYLTLLLGGIIFRSNTHFLALSELLIRYFSEKKSARDEVSTDFNKLTP